jgi:hypothetical protein
VFATPILNAGVSAPTLTVQQANCTLTPTSVSSLQCSWTVGEVTAGACQWPVATAYTIALPSTYFASPLPSSLISMDTNVTITRSGATLDSGAKVLAVQSPTIYSVTVSPSSQALNATPSLGISFLLSSSGLITTYFLQVTAIRTITSVPVFVVGTDQGTTITVGSCSGLYRQTTLYPSSATVLWFQLSGPNYCTSTGNVTVTIPMGLMAPQTPVGQQIAIQLLGIAADAHTVYWNMGPGNPSAAYNVSSGSPAAFPSAALATVSFLAVLLAFV